MMSSHVYDPGVFQPRDVEHARSIILSAPDRLTRERRWIEETSFLSEAIRAELGLSQLSMILDYGCGIGRLATALIDATECAVLGVDIDQKMLELATTHVGSHHFVACPRYLFGRMVEDGLRVDHAISVWVLQHCPALDADVELLHRAIRPQGLLFVANAIWRCIPTTEGFKSDGADVAAALSKRFAHRNDVDIPPALREFVAQPDGSCIEQPLNSLATISVWQSLNLSP